MKIYNSIEEFSPDFKVVLTIGTFDGVHIGHQSIIKALNDRAKRMGSQSVLLTFYPHPTHVLFPNDERLKLITTIEERSKLLYEYGLNHLIVQEFTSEFSRITSVNFVRDILVGKLRLSKLIIGYDHHFGRNREGNFEELLSLSKLYNYDIEKIDPHKHNNISVSSSKIRKLVSNAQMEKAKDYLGRYFTIKGEVIKGKSIGATLGYPTANLRIQNSWKLIPQDGVYAVLVYVQQKEYLGMMNIGSNPTFDINDRTIEVHILDFNQNIYGEELVVAFIKKIRDEKKFGSLEDLKKRIQIDENRIRLFSNAMTK